MPHTLHAVRTVDQTVAFCGECALTEKNRVQKLLRAWSEGVAIRGIVAIAPEPVWWHLGDPAETCTLQSDADVRRFVARMPHPLRGPLEMMACNAVDGKGVSTFGGERWLLGVTQRDALAAASAEAIERGIVMAAVGSATLDSVAAAVTAVQREGAGVVRLWATGRKESYVFTVSIRGVEAIDRCAMGFDAIYAAVQQVFGVTTATDAPRLFFEKPAEPAAAAHLASLIAPRLQSVLGGKPGADEPVSFACTGLTGQEAWFGRALARAMGLRYWQPNVNGYLDHLQLKLGADSREVSSLSLLGTLHLAAIHPLRSAAWHPTWGFISRAAPRRFRRPINVAVAPAVSPTTAPVAVAAAAAPPVSESMPEPNFSSPQFTPVIPSAIPVDSTATPEGGGGVDRHPPTPAPVSSANPADISPQRTPAGPVTAQATAPTSIGAETSQADPQLTASNGNGKPHPRAWSPEAEEEAIPPSRPSVIVVRRTGYWPVAGIFLALFGAGLAVKFHRDAEAVKAAAEAEKRAAYQAQTMAEREIAAAVEHVRLTSEQAVRADLRARELEAANTRELERVRGAMEAARREAIEQGRREAIEQARREAEEQTVRLLARELAAARAAADSGRLEVASKPAGADGHGDGRPVQRAPVSIEEPSAGRPAVRPTPVDPVSQELADGSVASKTTNVASIEPERATGAVAVSSSPAEIEFSIRPSSTYADATPLRRGRTPARLDDLPTGEYVVRFSRAGWPDRTERVIIERGARARVATTFQGGTVMINSSPTGATVLQGGRLLGRTPLTLGAVPPQEVTYELRVPGYEPLEVSGTITAGREIELNGRLLDLNRVVSVEDVRTPPRPYRTTPLNLGRITRAAPPNITVSFVVLLNGSLADVTVVGPVDRELARKTVEAMGKWKFYPGVSPAGYPVKVRMSMPVRIAGR